MFWLRARTREEERAQEAYERLQAVLRLVSDAVLEVDEQGVVTAANRQAAELFGLGPRAVVGLPFHALTDGSPDALEALEEARRGRRWAGELRFRRADGTLLVAFARAEAVAGLVVWSVVRPRELSLQEVGLHVRQALHDLPIAAQAFDPRGNVVATNRAWVELFGQPPPAREANVLRGGSVFGPRHRTALEQALRGEVVRLETFPWPAPEGRPAEGNPRILDVILCPVRGPEGSLHLVLAIALDTTEHRKLEEELRESEARYRTLIEESPDGVFLMADGLLRFVNRRFLQMFRTTSAECVDRLGPLAFCSPEDRPKLAQYLQERLSSPGPGAAVSFVGVRADGSRVECELQAHRVFLTSDLH
ncbi:MAG: hypothetical protein C4303_10410, partial [candidate division GAL15 bacterium]